MIKYETTVNKYLYDTDEVNDIIDTIQSSNYYNLDNCTQEKVEVLVNKINSFINNINVVQEDIVAERKETEEEAREYFGEDFINQLNEFFTDLDKQKTIIAIHGTSPDLCPNICDEGLRYKSPNLTSTAVTQHMEYGQRDMIVSNFSELLNWPHREYKGLVIIAIPYESFYKEGLWDHYQEGNSYSYDYRINPDFIAGYIDVENKTDIENYLNDVFYARHNSYWVNTENDLWNLVTENNVTLSSGSMIRKNIEPNKIPVSFKLLPYEGQARGVMQWTFTETGKSDRLFYVFMIGSPQINKLFLYEDLTAQCQSAFPNLYINNVILRQELSLIKE